MGSLGLNIVGEFMHVCSLARRNRDGELSNPDCIPLWLDRSGMSQNSKARYESLRYFSFLNTYIGSVLLFVTASINNYDYITTVF